MIPRDLHLGDEEFDQLKVGERIRVEIQKSRFQLRDPFIVSVGLFRGMATGSAEGVPVAAAPSLAKPVVEEDEVESEEAEAESEVEEGAESEEEEEEKEE
jgi:hypothetical protein